ADELQRVGQAPLILGGASQLRGLCEVLPCPDRVGRVQAGSDGGQAARRGGGIASRIRLGQTYLRALVGPDRVASIETDVGAAPTNSCHGLTARCSGPVNQS